VNPISARDAALLERLGRTAAAPTVDRRKTGTPHFQAGL
jgi:hypothetical protein